MNIIILTQSLEEKHLYGVLEKISCSKEIHNIYLVSSLMHRLDSNLVQKYKNIDKLHFIILNNVIENNLHNKEFILSNKVLKDQQYMYSDILSSLRWLPISLREDSDVVEFGMEFYYDLINYWMDFFNNNKINSLISLNKAHSSLDSILNRVAKDHNVNNILTVSLTGANYDTSEIFYSIYNNNTNKYIELNQYIELEKKELSLESNYSNFSDDYKTTFFSKVLFVAYRIRMVLNSGNSFEYKVNLLLKKLRRIIKSKILLYKNYFYIKSLFKYYNKVSYKNIDISKKYIYYCLHFDPEAATLPTDETYFNQLLNIRIVASSLPEGWRLYVKEHPHQLKCKEYLDVLGNQLHAIDLFRSKKFYNYINNLDGVYLVDLKSNHKILMQKAQFIVSNTGTVFREANYMKQQCITFSKHTLYNNLDNVNYVNDTKSCRKVIKEKKDLIDIKVDVNEMFKNYAYPLNIKEDNSSKMLELIFENKIYKILND